MKSVARLMSTREQQLAKQRVGISRNDHILAVSEVLETSLTFWNSFSMLCHPSHTLSHLLHMADCPKSTCHAYLQ